MEVPNNIVRHYGGHPKCRVCKCDLIVGENTHKSWLDTHQYICIADRKIIDEDRKRHRECERLKATFDAAAQHPVGQKLSELERAHLQAEEALERAIDSLNADIDEHHKFQEALYDDEPRRSFWRKVWDNESDIFWCLAFAVFSVTEFTSSHYVLSAVFALGFASGLARIFEDINND